MIHWSNFGNKYFLIELYLLMPFPSLKFIAGTLWMLKRLSLACYVHHLIYNDVTRLTYRLENISMISDFATTRSVRRVSIKSK